MINSSSNQVVNFCELSGLSEHGAHSSRGLGHLPLKEEITGSNPVCATNNSNTRKFVANSSCYNASPIGVSTNPLQIAFLNNFHYHFKMLRHKSTFNSSSLFVKTVPFLIRSFTPSPQAWN